METSNNIPNATIEDSVKAITALAELYDAKQAQTATQNGRSVRLYIDGDSYKTGEFTLTERIVEAFLQLLASLVGITTTTKGYGGEDGKIDLQHRIVENLSGANYKNVAIENNGVDNKKLVKAALALEKIQAKTGEIFTQLSQIFSLSVERAVGSENFKVLKREIESVGTDSIVADDNDSRRNSVSSNETDSEGSSPTPHSPLTLDDSLSFNNEQPVCTGGCNIAEVAETTRLSNIEKKARSDIAEPTLSGSAMNKTLGLSYGDRRNFIQSLISNKQKIDAAKYRLSTFTPSAELAEANIIELQELIDKHGHSSEERNKKLNELNEELKGLFESLEEDQKVLTVLSKRPSKRRTENLSENIKFKTERTQEINTERAELSKANKRIEEIQTTGIDSDLKEQSGLTISEYQALCGNIDDLSKLADLVDKHEEREEPRLALEKIFRINIAFHKGYTQITGTLGKLIVDKMVTGQRFSSAEIMGLNRATVKFNKEVAAL